MSDFWTYALPLLWDGLKMTVLITVLGILVAIVVAFTAGLARLSRHRWIRWPAVGFVEFFRGTSLVVQLFWLFFALPAFGIQLEPIAAGVLTLGLNEGAYAAEIVRGAIKSRPAGQDEACTALGMGRGLRMRRILIPQSIPSMLPGFGNISVDLLKNSALVSLITVPDLTFNALIVRNTFGRSAEVFLTILVMYFLLSQVISFFVAWLERRFAVDRVSSLQGLGEMELSTGGGGR